MKRFILAVFCLMPALLPAAPFFPEQAAFTLRFGNDLNPYKVLALYVLPGQVTAFTIGRDGTQSDFTVDGGQVVWDGRRKWRWRAPMQPGLYPLTIRRSMDRETMRLHAFVMWPADRVRGGKLNGYRIGRYPNKAKDGLAVYKPPTGFIEVNGENAQTLIAPHFQLGQFICKQKSAFPKYVSLKARLLLKLEFLLGTLNARGVRADSLVIMSGYRTPDYNRQLGNVLYSRHVWGDAADVFVDENPRDGMMDDLNGDGRFNRRDAEWLYDLLNRLSSNSRFKPLSGGLGAYGSTRQHGPFVHIDTRGFKARWGR